MGCVNSRFKTSETTSAEQIQAQEDSVSDALRNDLILGNISSRLCVKDLQTFRLVNCKWNQVSLSAFRSKTGWLDVSKLGEVYRRQLKSEGKLFGPNTMLLENLMQSREHFNQGLDSYRNMVELIKNSRQGFPCTKFCIGMGESKYFYHPDLFKELLVSISEYVTELTLLTGDNFEWDEEFNLEFSNLRKIKVVHFGNVEDSRKVEFLQHIVEHAPLLDTMNLVNCSEMKHFGSIIKILDGPQGQKIKTLHLKGLIDNDHWSKLTTLNLKLEDLVLVFKSTPFSAESLQFFLESQSNTLKQLSIPDTNDNSVGPIITFPCMKKLEILKIGQTGLDFEDICYIQQFPSLKHLALGGLVFQISCFFHSNMAPLPTVETLELPDYFDDLREIREAARIFPNVKKLKASTRTASLRVFGEAMRHVEELTICNGIGDTYKEHYRMNAVLTGYTKKELDDIQKRWEETKKLTIEEYKEPTPFCHGLKVLRIEYYIDDWVCLLGPLRMKSLRCLDLSNMNIYVKLYLKVELHEQVIQNMKKKFEVLLPASTEETVQMEEMQNDTQHQPRKRKSQINSFIFRVMNIF